ncbi:MAG: hypothetical protein NTW19_16305 [Planctomycetota bacterium]|nr:hypothetical protein [Planctomycetota bacterium]
MLFASPHLRDTRQPLDDDRTYTLGFLIVLALYIVTCFYTLSEVRYSLWGERLNATVVDAHQQRFGRGGQLELAVHYRFTDAGGTARDAWTAYPPSTQLAAGDEIEVLYVPGAWSSSQPAAFRAWWAVAVFTSMSAVMAIAVLVVALRASRDLRAMAVKREEEKEELASQRTQ